VRWGKLLRHLLRSLRIFRRQHFLLVHPEPHQTLDFLLET
jgi:hypothetical protein